MARARSTNLTDPDDIARSRFFRSDNYPFARAGIPAIRIVNGQTARLKLIEVEGLAPEDVRTRVRALR